MKFLLHLIAVYLPEINLAAILATIATALAFVKISVTNILGAKTNRINRRRRRALESDMWAIH